MSRSAKMVILDAAVVVSVAELFSVKLCCGEMVMAPLPVMLRATVTSSMPVMLMAPMVAPSGVSVVELSVSDGRVPLMPDTSVNVPVPIERLPLMVRLPVPTMALFAACSVIEPVAPVVMPPVALMVMSRCASDKNVPPVVITAPALTMKSRCGEMVTLPLLVMLVATVTSCIPVMLTTPTFAPSCE